MFDVITMGSNVVDAFASADSELIEIKTKDTDEELIAYPLGSKIVMNELRYDVGGNGVNAAVSFSKLGLKAGYIGKIGEDANGGEVLRRLMDNNIEFLGTKGHQSGFSVILNSEIGHDRTILTYKGANNDLKYEELDKDKINAKWLYISSMLGDSFETMKSVVSLAKERGMKIAFNPSETLAKNGYDYLKEILEKTDVLILNDVEAGYLVGEGSVEDKLHRLYDSGIKIIVITLGGDGLKARDEFNLYVGKPKPDRKILETTGAGDALASTFVAGLALEKDFETCLRMGMLNAESVISHYGAQGKLLTRDEIQGALASDEREMSKSGF